MNKLYKLVSIFILVALLAACGGQATVEPVKPTEPPKPTEAPKPTEPPKPTEAPVPTAVKQEPLPEGVANVLTLYLRKGVKWSDGSGDLTARDVIGTYNILWVYQDASWNYLKDVKAKDDYTVEFYISTPSPRILRLLLRSNQPYPYSVYGKWMDQAAEMRAKNVDRKSDEVAKWKTDLEGLKVEDVVVYGPFKLDPKSVTEAQLELVKNPTGFNADKIAIEKVIVYYGETASSVPLVLSDEIDYSTHGYTPADVAAFKAKPNIKIIGGPTGTGPGLWFNQAVYPLNKKEVRQAFAYIIDRQENATVAMGEAGKALKYMAGFTDVAVEAWISKEVIAKLNPYNKDWKKAEELLTKAGCKKGSDGIWVDDKGNKMEYELSVPADFADWLGSAENVAQQLTAFGIKATVRGYQSSERATVQKEGKYQILVDLSLYYNPPHPHTSFNYYLNAPRNNPEATDNLKGYNWPWKQKLPDGTEVYVPDLLKGASAGFDPEKQKPYIEKLALLVNEELPVLALFERYATDPIAEGPRITGWLPLDNKIYKNSQADNYITIQFLNGQLKPVAGSDKSFRTAYPYPQPPNYSLNLWPSNSLPQSVGSPAYHLMYPPFAFFMWADGVYQPMLAEKFELR